jgi:hypothetical protein
VYDCETSIRLRIGDSHVCKCCVGGLRTQLSSSISPKIESRNCGQPNPWLITCYHWRTLRGSGICSGICAPGICAHTSENTSTFLMTYIVPCPIKFELRKLVTQFIRIARYFSSMAAISSDLANAILLTALSHWLFLILLAVAARLVYLRYFHPLSKIPGEILFLCKLTWIWSMEHFTPFIKMYSSVITRHLRSPKFFGSLHIALLSMKVESDIESSKAHFWHQSRIFGETSRSERCPKGF